MSSFWIESTKNLEKNFSRLNKNIEADICIIGAGITGVLSAYYLAKEGKNIVVLEKDKICEKTSGNTTAKITSQHGLFYKYLLQSKGYEFSKKYYEVNEEAIKNIEEIVKKEKINCDFEKQSAYVFTQKDEEINKIKDEAESVKKIGGICGQNSSQSYIYNSYNIGKIDCKIASGCVDANFGEISNCFYLNSCILNENNAEYSRDENQMRNEIIESLGVEFKEDTENKNDGYPILSWQ